jgi:hypothetical protein
MGAYSSLYDPFAVHSQPAIENAGIRTGEIVGVRAWKLGSDGLLYSMFIDGYAWKPGAIEHARCVKTGWGDGLHAFKTIKQAKKEYWTGFFMPIVLGEVDLWGEVIEYEKGWKAEYAAIRNFLEISEEGFLRRCFGMNSRLDALRKHYNVQ